MAWSGSEADYTITWAGQEWTLTLSGERPGLRRAGRPGSVLTLDGVAATGRRQPNACCGSTLTGVELVRSRVEATFRPPDWGGLVVRAAWSPSEDEDGIDLEVQVSATSVDELKAVEVFVVSQFLIPEERITRRVHPRDLHCAALSYDGRESAHDLSCLITYPPSLLERPWRLRVNDIATWDDVGSDYVALTHPQDVSRLIELYAPTAIGIRHAFFGHDLEKGVLVRGRVRSIWLNGDDVVERSAAAFRRFRELPPPLGS